ncbi:hypothetical protein [Streptomyces sp. NBC_01197]|uniref:hypothetical protein n=1 Tax=Streptomyces sp. NBC_01197 TaxID=2903768 RepID=UPI002E15AAE2|nr:hypothetical protein OG452_08875 [Streptomyces sp. NBC_01197]
MTATRKSALVSVIGCAFVLMASASATAERAGSSSSTSSPSSKATKGPNRTITSQVSIKYHSSGNSGVHSGPLASTDSNWTPPACWYAPEWSATEFQQFRQGVYVSAVHDPGLPNDVRGEISDQNQKYAGDNYNIDKEKEGMWWGPQFNDDASLADQMKCDKDPFWVKKGETPDVPEAIKPETLAGLAYQQMQVPGTKVSLAPAGASKVNLPTWAWLDKADFKPISVTASLDIGGFHAEATTTATADSLSLDPGTDDAQVLPASGRCALNSDGSIGEPYARGKANQTPPCGVVYQRSSGGGTFNLRATATWRISWTGTGGAGGSLPDGEYGHDQPVTVQEIQAVNR